MSRGQHNSTRRLAGLGLGMVAALGLVGCSAGQITQTDSQLPAVNGAMAQAGPLAVRDAKLAYPHGGFYAQGAAAPLILTIVNSGAAEDALVEVSSSFASEVELDGDKSLPGTAALSVGTPHQEASDGHASSAAPTAAPTSAAGQVGKLKIVLEGLKEKLYPGRSIPVTFHFAKSGTITVELPIGEPSHARAETEGH